MLYNERWCPYRLRVHISHSHTHTCMYAHTHTHTCAHTHVHTHTCTHTHTHTPSLPRNRGQNLLVRVLGWWEQSWLRHELLGGQSNVSASSLSGQQHRLLLLWCQDAAVLLQVGVKHCKDTHLPSTGVKHCKDTHLPSTGVKHCKDTHLPSTGVKHCKDTHLPSTGVKHC